MLEYFTMFHCDARVAADASLISTSGANTGTQLCYKYQLQDDETLWTDGNPRFEKSMRVKTYLISSIGIKVDYAFMMGETILTGANMLALGTAAAATLLAMF